MKYEDMSDLTIDRKVFVQMYGECIGDKDMDRVWQQGKFRPCLNPSDAWSIIVENEISIEFLDGGYVDVKLDTDFGTFCPDDAYPKERAFKAAMICFLKMKDTENVL